MAGSIPGEHLTADLGTLLLLLNLRSVFPVPLSRAFHSTGMFQMSCWDVPEVVLLVPGAYVGLQGCPSGHVTYPGDIC